jgi:hypothetical protein
VTPEEASEGPVARVPRARRQNEKKCGGTCLHDRFLAESELMTVRVTSFVDALSAGTIDSRVVIAESKPGQRRCLFLRISLEPGQCIARAVE